LKFQAVAEKTAKDARGLLYFAAPGTLKQTTRGFWLENKTQLLTKNHITLSQILII